MWQLKSLVHKTRKLLVIVFSFYDIISYYETRSIWFGLVHHSKRHYKYPPGVRQVQVVSTYLNPERDVVFQHITAVVSEPTVSHSNRYWAPVLVSPPPPPVAFRRNRPEQCRWALHANAVTWRSTSGAITMSDDGPADIMTMTTILPGKKKFKSTWKRITSRKNDNDERWWLT